jgi:hypothetical protein
VDPELAIAVERQYQAFWRRPPDEVVGCPCCTTAEQLLALVQTPLRELIAKELDFYAFKAITTVGDASDLRYYWPRLAELALRGELTTDLEVTFSKPREGEWRSWPFSQQEALLAFARAQMRALAQKGANSGSDHEIDTWVCAFGQFADDVTALLYPFLCSEPGPASALLQLYNRNEGDLARGALWNTFWDAVPENAERMRTWFASDEVLVALVRALDQTA